MSKDDFQKIIVESIDEKPEAQPHAVDAEGTRFDPEIHSTNKDGTPRTTSRGKFWKKGGTAVTGQKSTVAATPTAGPSNYEMQGHLAATLVSNTAEHLLSPNMKATDDEIKMLAPVYGRVFEHYGMEDLPPVWAAVYMTVVVFGPKVDETAKARVRLGYYRLTGKRGQDAQLSDREDEHGKNSTVKAHSKGA